MDKFRETKLVFVTLFHFVTSIVHLSSLKASNSIRYTCHLLLFLLYVFFIMTLKDIPNIAL